jgi:Tol biopolymer transport system component
VRYEPRTWGVTAVATAVLVCLPALAGAQYFGRNKVQYRTFSFQVLKTDHFDIYYYPEEREAAEIASRMAERWYARLSRFFSHDLHGRQAVILYAVPEHFQQTNAVEGLIGEGTGGVTEALKRRVVLPMSGSLADTDHVLGHELVHAFQYDITGTDPRGSGASMPGILEYPLWFVEGMAEYVSLGPVDRQTAMWMRDAAMHEAIPNIRDLDNPKYFPYRWGQAFWSYIGATYGDRAVASLLRSGANPRTDLAGFARQLGTDPATLNADWHRAIETSTSAIVADEPSLQSQPHLIISHATGSGRLNVGPRLSPDGRQIAFFSERDEFSIDLFVADAQTGRIERKVLHQATNPHFDSLEFLNSAGAWNPDGRELALTAVRSGRPVMALIDPQNGNILREIELPGLDDALDPAFAPDGRAIVFSGNRGGLFDLYRLWLDSGRLDRLTHDPFADLEPTFTPDGHAIVFVTERFSTDLATLEPGPLRLARLDLATDAVTPIPAFLKGQHLSPQVSADGRTLTFIAAPDGISNLYEMPIDGGPILQITSFVTGVAGITASSPALSEARASGRLAFSVFDEAGQAIYTLDPAHVVGLVPPPVSDRGAILPGRTAPGGELDGLLTNYTRGLPAASAPDPSVAYRPRLSLDAIGQPTVSAGVGQFGGFVGGSVSAFFSDMLGDRLLGVGAQVGGALADFGGQLQYANLKHRWNWAASVEQIPYRIEYLTYGASAQPGQIEVADIIQRQTSRGASGVAAYPFSSSTRLEVTGGAHQLTFTQDAKIGDYSADTLQLVSHREEQTTLARPLYLAEGSVALVHDSSYFGATSPVYGARYRFELGQNLGTLKYTSVLADWRQYFMPKRPVTLAFRLLHYGRYGQDAEDSELVGLYAGYPELVHGYGFGSFSPAECQSGSASPSCAVFDNLIGSRLLVANAEIRAPLLGLFRGDIQYGRIPVEVAAFMDAGVTWTKDTLPQFLGGTRKLLRSYGGAVRVNAFGLFVVELSAARPLDRVEKGWQWQLGIREGF